MDKAGYIAQLERMLAGQRKQREDLQQQLDTLRQEKEQLDSKKKRLESQYETVAGRLASVTTGEANPVHQACIMDDCSAMTAVDGTHWARLTKFATHAPAFGRASGLCRTFRGTHSKLKPGMYKNGCDTVRTGFVAC